MRKKCSRCKRLKSTLTGFHLSNSTPDGLHTLCKECRCEYNRPRARHYARVKRAMKEGKHAERH